MGLRGFRSRLNGGGWGETYIKYGERGKQRGEIERLSK